MASLELDGRVRLSVYRHFVGRGLAPSVEDLSDERGIRIGSIRPGAAGRQRKRRRCSPRWASPTRSGVYPHLPHP